MFLLKKREMVKIPRVSAVGIFSQKTPLGVVARGNLRDQIMESAATMSLLQQIHTGASPHFQDITTKQKKSHLFDSSRLFSSYVPHHDLGGDPASYGPIPGIGDGKPVKDLLAWEQQCHSTFALLAAKKVLSTDELRRTIEALTPKQYNDWSYYEKWTAAMVTLLLERRVILHDELQKALFGDSSSLHSSEIESQPLFRQGDFVRVKRFLSNAEWRRPHIRTPGYIYGVAGEIERVCGQHGDPSFLAFGLEAPKLQLYRVRFRQKDIWPEQYDLDHDDHNDLVEVELYEHWLEPAEQKQGHSFQDQILFDHTSGDDCTQHHHGHMHEHDGNVHAHEARATVESRAIQKEGPPTPGKELFQAFSRVLLEKGVLTADEIRSMSEKMDTAATNLDGATLVVQAWMDPAFEEHLLSDAASAAKTIGISASNPNAPTVLTVLKNTPKVHNIVVCTLCSCYPSGLLGIAPSWYKSREYRSRTVREPRRVLEEFGVFLPKDIAIRVHDSTADHRYIVLPMRPRGTENWNFKQLRSLVSRDMMIGVAIPPASA